MSQQNEGLKAFIAGEDLQPYRRVKLSSGLGNTVVYADQADGNDYLGFTQHAADEGDHVTVRLKTAGKTYKAQASSVIVAGSVVYGTDDGKVGADDSGDPVGYSLEAASGEDVIVEVIPISAGSAEINGGSVAIEPENSNGTLPILFRKTGITNATLALDIVSPMPYKVEVVDWWLINRGTTTAYVSLKNGVLAIGNVMSGTVENARVQGTPIVNSVINAGGSLKVSTADAITFDIFVLAMKVE